VSAGLSIERAIFAPRYPRRKSAGRSRAGVATAENLAARQCGPAFPIFQRPRRRIWPFALQPRPRSADRTPSPAAVSKKREFFKYLPETIGYFSLRKPKSGAWRLAANLQKPAIGGPFCKYQGHYLSAPDCLAGDAVLIARVSRRFPCYQGI
jgi:hypothetical protein